MDGDDFATSCNFLKEPVSLRDLIGSGTNFEINTNFEEELANDMFEECHLGSDDEDEDGADDVAGSVLVSPWTKPFAELKEHMVAIDEHIWKKTIKPGAVEDGTVPLNARVCIRYNAYWEGEGAPFDSSFLRGTAFSFYTGHGAVLEGLECAVRTMCRGEHAQFVISYHKLFHEMGCPPRVKPRADGLFIIELVSFNRVGDIDAEQALPAEDRNKYELMEDKVKEIHLKGLDFFGQGLYRNACRAFEKAANILKFCHLANEEQEREQTAFLLKLYTNLAVCYIKINAPSKACVMCSEIRHLTNDKPSCKALFQEGRALLMLGEFGKARQALIRAQRLEPQNRDISKELKVLDQRYARYKENERSIWTKAMGIVKESDTKAERNAKVLNDDDLSDLEKEMLELMRDFKEDAALTKFKLPPGLTDKEIDTLDALARRLDLKVSRNPLDHNSYTVTK